MKDERWDEFLEELNKVCCRYQHSLTDIEIEAEWLAERYGYPKQIGPLALEKCDHWHWSGYCDCGDRDGYGCYDEKACEVCNKARAVAQSLIRLAGAGGCTVTDFDEMMKRIYSPERIETLVMKHPWFNGVIDLA